MIIKAVYIQNTIPDHHTTATVILTTDYKTDIFMHNKIVERGSIQKVWFQILKLVFKYQEKVANNNSNIIIVFEYQF